jgi:hypothetical protein
MSRPAIHHVFTHLLGIAQAIMPHLLSVKRLATAEQIKKH